MSLPQTGPELAAMPSHDVPAKSQALEIKASPVIDHHDLSQEMPDWAMRDSTGVAHKPVCIEATLEQGTSLMAQGVARLQLSQAVAGLPDTFYRMRVSEGKRWRRLWLLRQGYSHYSMNQS